MRLYETPCLYKDETGEMKVSQEWGREQNNNNNNNNNNKKGGGVTGIKKKKKKKKKKASANPRRKTEWTSL